MKGFSANILVGNGAFSVVADKCHEVRLAFSKAADNRIRPITVDLQDLDHIIALLMHVRESLITEFEGGIREFMGIEEPVKSKKENAHLDSAPDAH